MVRFIDLFAGIGGIRMAYERAGAECVFSSEIDKFARQTYEANFGDVPAGDITQIEADDIPDHDVLLGGFPCQPFSIAGVSKKNSLGHEHGFREKTSGNLFFHIARILDAKQPKAFMLENVKHLERHDKGRTFRVIRQTLINELDPGYHIFAHVIDAQHYVPQHRERIFIVGFRKDLFPGIEFHFPQPPDTRPVEFTDILDADVNDKYTLSDKLWSYLKAYKTKHQRRGNGFGYGMVATLPGTVTRTLSARYYKDGSEILLYQPYKNPRRLTPRECARLMGYPDSFKIPVSDTQGYKQFGNSVVVPVVEDIARVLVPRVAALKTTASRQHLPVVRHARTVSPYRKYAQLPLAR
jgi:DNA (cytosine-5)-methyltransferase 1